VISALFSSVDFVLGPSLVMNFVGGCVAKDYQSPNLS
jgi:hypothetical protein